MDHRTQAFREKFAAAAHVFGVAPHQIVSLKVRDTVNSYSVYHEFFHRLAHEAELDCRPVEGNFQGHGYALTRGKTTVLAVEHETGLELLYIAGSIASLISLVPVVLQGWRAFRHHRADSLGHRDDRLELRRMDETGRLIEEPAPLDGASHADLRSALAWVAMENEFRRLTERIDVLTTKVTALEKKPGPPRQKRKRARQRKPNQ